MGYFNDKYISHDRHITVARKANFKLAFNIISSVFVFRVVVFVAVVFYLSVLMVEMESYSIAQASLKLKILLPPLPKC